MPSSTTSQSPSPVGVETAKADQAVPVHPISPSPIEDASTPAVSPEDGNDFPVVAPATEASVTPSGDDSSKPFKPKGGLFGSLFRRSKLPKPSSDSPPPSPAVNISTPDEVASSAIEDSAFLPTPSALTPVVTEANVTEVTTPSTSEPVTALAGETVAIPTSDSSVITSTIKTAADVSTKSSGSKFFSFSRKKARNSDSAPTSPVEPPAQCLVEPVTEELIEKVEAVTDTPDEMSTVVVEDELSSPLAMSSSDEKRKSSLFGRLSLLRKHPKDSKIESVTPVTEEPVIEEIPVEQTTVDDDNVPIEAGAQVAVKTVVSEDTPAEASCTATTVQANIIQANVEPVSTVESVERGVVDEISASDETGTEVTPVDEIAGVKPEEQVLPQSEMSDMSEPSEPSEEVPRKVNDRQSRFLGGLLHSLTSRRSKTNEDAHESQPIEGEDIVMIEESNVATPMVEESVDVPTPVVEGEILSETEPEPSAAVEGEIPITPVPEKLPKMKLGLSLNLFRAKSSGEAAVHDESADDAPTQAESLVQANDAILRASYLLKPATLTRAIHRRHFTLHESGSLAMRIQAADPVEAKVYSLTSASDVSVPTASKVDYELIVKISDKKTIVLVACSEIERDAWVDAISEVIEIIKDRQVAATANEVSVSSPVDSAAPVIAGVESDAHAPMTLDDTTAPKAAEESTTQTTPLGHEDAPAPMDTKFMDETAPTKSTVSPPVESTSKNEHASQTCAHPDEAPASSA